MFSNLVDFRGRRHLAFLIRFLVGPIFQGAILDSEKIEPIVIETIVYCLSLLLIGYPSYKPGILLSSIISAFCLP